MRDRLIELICNCPSKIMGANMFLEKISADLADHLIKNGVIVTPCVAMVEQVLKDGKIDRQKTLHCAGKYSVVYIDKSKWKIPLIDITEQCYNDEKALERIQALKGGVMADITYCINNLCPFKECERHPSKISEAAIKGKGYVSVANYDGVCRKYISHLVDESKEGGDNV